MLPKQTHSTRRGILFHFLTGQECQLIQLYTANSSFTCILTAGADIPPTTAVSDYSGPLRYGLATWLVPQDRPVPDESQRAIFDQGITLHPFTVPVVWAGWISINAFAFLLAGFGMRCGWDRARMTGLSLLIFANAGSVIGGIAGLIAWPFAWFAHHVPVPSVAACLSVLLSGFAVERVQGRRVARRAIVGVALWGLASASSVAYYGLRYDWGGLDNSRYLFAVNAIVGFGAAAVGGFIFGLLDSATDQGAGRTILAVPIRVASRFLLTAAMSVLFLAPARSGAQTMTIKPDPDPGIKGEGFVDYIGRYGEVFKLRGGWQTVPSMHGDAEVINLYPQFRPDRPDWDLEKFRPTPADFAPENFTRLELIQLAIIPRKSDAFQSLADLRLAKIRDLRDSGAAFMVVDHPLFDAYRGDWPKGTFEIRIQKPYQLTQLYTANSSFTCILTAGLDTPPSAVIDSHYGFLRYGLAVWMTPQEQAAPDESPRAIVAQGISLHPFSIPAVWGSWIAITGLGCLLAGIGLGKRKSALSRVSLSVVVFSNAGAMLGGAFGLLLWPLAWFSHHFPVPSAIACLLMPLVAFAMKRVGGMAGRRRSMVAVSLWALAASAVIGYYGRLEWGGGDYARYQFAFNAIISFVFFAVGGFLFGFLDSSDAGGAILALCSLFLLAPRAKSQTLPSDGELAARDKKDARAAVRGLPGANL